MSTPPPPPQHGPYYGASMPPIPIPHGELIVFLLAILTLGIIALIAKTVNANELVEYGAYITIAYLIARGIAKRGNVHEGR